MSDQLAFNQQDRYMVGFALLILGLVLLFIQFYLLRRKPKANDFGQIPDEPVEDHRANIKTSPSRYQRALSRASNSSETSASVPSETNSKLYQKSAAVVSSKESIEDTKDDAMVDNDQAQITITVEKAPESNPLLPDKPEEANIIIISNSYIGAKENKSQMTVQSPTTRKVSILDDSVETGSGKKKDAEKSPPTQKSESESKSNSFSSSSLSKDSVIFSDESLYSFNDEMSVSILGDESKCLQDSDFNALSNSSQASSRSSVLSIEPSTVSSKKADPWYRKFKKWTTKNLQKLKMKKTTESKSDKPDQNSGESQKSEVKTDTGNPDSHHNRREKVGDDHENPDEKNDSTRKVTRPKTMNKSSRPDD